MAAVGGAFGGSRGLQAVPPEKGVFPLDHLHECQAAMKDYMSCLKANNHKVDKCRGFSKAYLECRMERNLMAKQELSELGFKKEDNTPLPNVSCDSVQEKLQQKEQTGFVSGLPKKKV